MTTVNKTRSVGCFLFHHGKADNSGEVGLMCALVFTIGNNLVLILQKKERCIYIHIYFF